MARVRRIDAEIRLRVVLDEQSGRLDVLRRIGADVLPRRGARTLRASALREPLLWSQPEQDDDLRRVAAHALGGGGHTCHSPRRVAASEGGIRLVALRGYSSVRGCCADPEAERDDKPDASSHRHEHSDGMRAEKFVDQLAAAQIGATY